jgi:hypothetical protein
VQVGNNLLFIGNAGNGNGSTAITNGTGVQRIPLETSNPPPVAGNDPIMILPGISTQLAGSGPDFTPFSLFFANPNTMYESDEGRGYAVALSQHAGIDKYTFPSGSWHFDCALRDRIGSTQSVTGFGVVTTTGLRQIMGMDTRNDTVTLYGVTATTDSITQPDPAGNINSKGNLVTTDSMDAVADPNAVVLITNAPEPAPLLVLGPAMADLAGFRRRRRG